jgi:hypothetical protein
MSDHIPDPGKMVSARDVIIDAVWYQDSQEKNADRILFALAAAGYAVVPVEPTDAMCMAGEECIVCSEGCLLAEDVYFAMLAAAKETQA